jgi:hypothetical protein
MEMHNKIKVERIYNCDTYCIGKLYVNDIYICDTIEDTVRDLPKSCPNTAKGKECKCKEKIKGKTAIPAGHYKVLFKYSPKYQQNMLRIENVNHFLGILIHSGNTAVHTIGCIIVGYNKQKGMVLNSKEALRKLLDELNVMHPNTVITIDIINLFKEEKKD